MRCWRILMLAIGLVVSAAPAWAEGPAESARRPNVVLILADDLGYMDIGANNPKTFYETPQIDKLAERGVRFTQGYSACCVCSPTRASILTGRYPQRFGLTDFIPGMRSAKLKSAENADHMPLAEVTLAETFRAAGYTTFMAGKWHLGGGEFSPNAQGFGPGLVPAGNDPGKAQFWYPPASTPPPGPKDDPKTTDRIAGECEKFIEANKDRPFFAYLPFPAVHVPLGARADLVTKYEKKKSAAPGDEWGKEGASKVRLVQNNAVYAAMLEQMDRGIGRVMEALSRNGLAERTIVIFLSDNGGLSTAEGHPTSNLPLRAGKGWPYEGGVRVPWIVAGPGVAKGGTVCDEPVMTIDFFPTLLELTGVAPLPGPARDGESFVPLLAGKSLQRKSPLFWHYPHYSNQGGGPCSAVREGEWKLIEWYEDNRLELFRIGADPGERHDLVKQEPERTKALHEKLIAWRKDVGAKMPTPNPNYKPQADK